MKHAPFLPDPLRLCGFALLWIVAVQAQGLPGDDLDAYRRDLAYRLEAPLAEGRDCAAALGHFLKARELRDEATAEEVKALYFKGFAALDRELKALPLPAAPKLPQQVKLALGERVELSRQGEAMVEMLRMPAADPKVAVRVARFKADGLQQYGVVAYPDDGERYPLVVFLHGAAYGVPALFLTWMERLAANGYVVAAPALRGEPLWSEPKYVTAGKDLECEGEIENLAGEVTDTIAMADGALRLPMVRGSKYAVVGHSFGAGAGLLAATRDERIACVVSYDAWLTNAFRFYWERLRGGSPAYWGSWEAFVAAHTPAQQLQELLRRSMVHQAERSKAPLLLLIGGAYNGSTYHRSHAELVARLQAHDKPHRYEIIPGGGHNFIMYPQEEPAQTAYKLQTEWLQQYHPPGAAAAD